MEENKTAQVPAAYRKPAINRKTTISSMNIGDVHYVHFSAVAIDRNWGVWLDPNAEAEPWMDRRTVRGNPPRPIEVSRMSETEYELNFANSDAARAHTWEHGVEETHAPYFIPVKAVY